MLGLDATAGRVKTPFSPPAELELLSAADVVPLDFAVGSAVPHAATTIAVAAARAVKATARVLLIDIPPRKTTATLSVGRRWPTSPRSPRGPHAASDSTTL